MNQMPIHARRAASVFVPVLVLVLACGGGDEPADPCRATSHAEALDCLGVPEDDTPRADTTGQPLPEAYAPLGTTALVGASRELFLAGMRIAPPTPVGPGAPLDNRAATVALADDTTHALGTTVLDLRPSGTVWEGDATSPHPSSQTTRDAAAPDLDGDGTDDLVVAFLDGADPVDAGVVFFERVGAIARQPVVTVAGALDVALVRADVDGDGTDELALAVATPGAGMLYIVDVDAAGRFAVAEAATLTLPRIAIGGASIELAAGNLDRDRGEEIAIVLNESGGSGTSTYAIVDDASAAHAALVTSGIVRVQDGGNFQAAVADVAIGDVDADGKGEVVFAGLTELHDQSCTSVRQVYLVLDDAGDAPSPLAPIAQRSEMVRYVPSSGCDEVSVELPVRHVFVNTLDVDGDGAAEIQANLQVFDDLRAGPFVVIHTIDQQVLAGSDGRGGSALTTSTTAMSVADLDGNGRDEIIVFGQHTDQIVVWGLDGPNLDTAIFRQMLVLPTATYNSQTRVFPIIVPTNVDSDGAVLKYSAADYRFVFTEPVIMAAIAAAPCADGIGQNTAACTTSYGLSEAVTGGADASVTVSAGVFVSFDATDPFFKIGPVGRASVTTSASFSASRAYSLEETVEYTTGPIEDTVVFTTIPLDQYSYTIVAHPDPELVGTTVTVNLPRSPVTLQVERGFYNASVAPGSFLVDEQVFRHRVGDIGSYSNEATAEVLIDTGGRARLGPLGELVDLAGEPLGDLIDTLLGRGMKSSRAITVGQGSGQTSTEIVFSEQTAYRGGVEIAFEAELGLSVGGVAVGTTVGASLGAGLSWGTSSATIYRGTIGSIDAGHFAEHLYSAGLFTYVYNYGDRDARQFEVIDYWVER